MKSLQTLLQQQNIRTEHYLHYAPYFLQRWEHTFLPLSDDEKARIFLHSDRYSCGYLWHVFSYERRTHVKEAAANDAFFKQQKGRCYIFSQHINDVVIVHNGAALLPS